MKERRSVSNPLCSHGTPRSTTLRPVLKWGVAEAIGPRETMEDAWFVKEKFESWTYVR